MKHPDTVAAARWSAAIGWALTSVTAVIAALNVGDGIATALLVVLAVIACLRFAANAVLWLGADRRENP